MVVVLVVVVVVVVIVVLVVVVVAVVVVMAVLVLVLVLVAVAVVVVVVVVVVLVVVMAVAAMAVVAVIDRSSTTQTVTHAPRHNSSANMYSMPNTFENSTFHHVRISINRPAYRPYDISTYFNISILRYLRIYRYSITVHQSCDTTITPTYL